MPLPSLPLDVWFRISTVMDSASLSALSQVNNALNKIAMDVTHFRRHLPVPPSQHTHILQLYRRMCALNHPRDSFSSTQLSTNYRMLCISQDNLLLLDVDKARLIALPCGLTVEAKEIIGNIRPRNKDTTLGHLEDRVLLLPDGHVGFTYGVNGSRLSVLDLKSGQVTAHKLRRKRPCKEIVNGKAVHVAGINAEWLLYRVDETTVGIFDWRTGTVVREIDTSNDNIKFVIGECPAIDDASVVGLVYQKAKGSINEILAKGFDDIEMVFRVDEEKVAYSVLRSADTKTHVLVTAPSAGSHRPVAFIAHRKHGDCEKWWSGPFRNGISYPELQENGRVISVARRPFLRKTRYCCACRLSPTWPLWIVLKEEDSKWCTTEEITVRTLKDRVPPVWARRTSHGGLAVMAGKREGVIDLVRISREGETTKQECLKSWKIENLSNLCVVADHFIVATSDDQKLHLLHFDKFCSGAAGVYACPLTGLVTYCYFPEEIRDSEDYLRSHKRRRVCEGSAQA